MKVSTPTSSSFICRLQMGLTSLRLVTRINDAFGGWTYSVFHVGHGRFVVPESPVSDSDSGRRAAESVVRECFAMSKVGFDWQADGERREFPDEASRLRPCVGDELSFQQTSLLSE